MYDHPLAVYSCFSEEDGSAECNTWGYVSGLTHSYFENNDSTAGSALMMYLSKSGAPAPHWRALLRSYKKFRTLAVLREIQCLTAYVLEQEEQDAPLSYIPPDYIDDFVEEDYE